MMKRWALWGGDLLRLWQTKAPKFLESCRDQGLSILSENRIMFCGGLKAA